MLSNESISFKEEEEEGQTPNKDIHNDGACHTKQLLCMMEPCFSANEHLPPGAME